MKIIAIGDIHGRDTWKQIINQETFDKVVFIGDYVDSFDVPASIQRDNLLDILEYKRANMDKVILLFGNHDWHYLPTSQETYSGYQRHMRLAFGEILSNAIKEKLITMCWCYNDIVFTHAGVTRTWLYSREIDPTVHSLVEIKDILNDLLIYKPNSFEFSMGANYSPYGDDITQSPLWVRPTSLRKDKLKSLFYICGHTSQDSIKFTDDVILIDTLGSSKEYLIYDDGTFKIGKIN